MAGRIERDPERIEAESFAIIDREVGSHPFDTAEWPVVRRIIHTTADFDFVARTRFAAGVLDRARAALRAGASMVCDTNMVLAGISQNRLRSLGCTLDCYVADAEVARRAAQEGVTRSIVALRRGVDAGCRIFVIGNAPTALFELLQLAEAGKVEPELVIGVPVGFVGAAEAKDLLAASDLPFITCLGRKGGSTVAAAICNALLIQAMEG